MDTDGESALEKFKSFTGCEDNAECEQLIEACDGDVARAADLYFQQRPVISSKDPQCSSSSNSNTDHDTNANGNRRITRSSSKHTLTNMAGPSKARHAVTFNGSTRSSILNKDSQKCNETDVHNDDDCMIVDEDVRAPIAPVRGPIVEQSFHQQYGSRTRTARVSVFDSFRDFRGESEDRLAAFQNGTSTANAATRTGRRSLQVLFRPPVELIFRGDWELARSEAQRRGVWLMVNVQNVCEFACQTLNRDVWSNTAVKELIRSNFIFWQIYHDSADGTRISNYYRITSHPAIFVVDPRTGELLIEFRAPDAVSFCDQVTSFLETFPDFAARDRHLIGATAPAPSTDLTPPKPTESHISDVTDVDEGPSSSRNGHRRKRIHLTSNDSDEEEVKKSRKAAEDVPDIDAMVCGVSKATTVDQDEWRSCLGVADGKGRKISLVLRLPDGNRQTVEMEDTTPIRAVFLLIAGLGFSPCEHHLVLSYPKREYSFEDADRSLRELQLNKRELIHVELK